MRSVHRIIYLRDNLGMQEFTTGHKTLKGMWAKNLPDMGNVPCTK